jgi:hypothetical protein
MSDTTRDTALQNIGTQLGELITLISSNLVIFGAPQTYATGTWTPTLNFGGSATGVTITSNGTFTQIGREFIYRFKIVVQALGAASGVATISGLLNTSNAAQPNNGAGGIITSYSSMASISALPFLNIGTASSIASLFQAGSASSIALTVSNFRTGSSIAGQFGFYV